MSWPTIHPVSGENKTGEKKTQGHYILKSMVATDLWDLLVHSAADSFGCRLRH